MDDLLDKIARDRGFASKTEVIRRAISIYSALLDEIGPDTNEIRIAGQNAAEKILLLTDC